uniref:Protein kinase domain-containing protein n=1 Tax=Amphimedon queenslandica TaxID=400682 RepID=A0A1X7TMB3_AMPQE
MAAKVANDWLKPIPIENVEETGKELGRGSYGVVIEVIVNGQRCAGKKLHNLISEGQVARKFTEEALLHNMQHHPNIVDFLGVYYAPHSTLPTLVMEYLPMTLASCLESNNLKIQMKYAILLDVAKGLIYLHQKNPCVIHRDLTANNVLLTHNLLQAKISDLGMSRKWADTMLTKAPGNIAVMPPEALEDNPVYDHKLDVFSYGCLILHVLTGQFPQPTNQFKPKPSRKSADDYIKVPECNRRSYYIEKLPQVSDLTSLVKQCLSDDPTKRPEIKIASSIIEEFISHVVVDGVEEVEIRELGIGVGVEETAKALLTAELTSLLTASWMTATIVEGVKIGAEDDDEEEDGAEEEAEELAEDVAIDKQLENQTFLL